MEYVKFNDHLLPFSGHSEMVEAKPSPSLFQSDCVSADKCVLTPCFKESCLSTCPSGSDCLPPHSEDDWCLCLHNVSCGECSSATEHREACLQAQKGTPLWIIAVLLPIIILILLLILFCFVLKRQGRLSAAKKRTQVCRALPTKQNGTDNVAFSLDHGDGGLQDVSNESSKQPDLIVPGELMRGVESYSEGGLSSNLTGFGGSELEYYEIDSTYTACYPSIDLSGSIDVCGVNSLGLDPWVKGTSPRKLSPSPSMKKQDPPSQPRSSTLGNWKPHTKRSSGVNLEAVQCRVNQSRLLYKKKLSPELADPPRFLTVEEVKRLDHMGDVSQLHAGPPKPFRVPESSSESESHSSFTCSEYDCERELCFICAQENRRGHATEGRGSQI